MFWGLTCLTSTRIAISWSSYRKTPKNWDTWNPSKRIIEPPHDKTNKMTAHSENSDHPGHPPSLISLRCALNGKLGTHTFFMQTAKTDQTGQMPRLILVFAGRICHFVGFVMRQLILCGFTFWECGRQIKEWQTVQTLIRLILKECSDRCLHWYQRPVCHYRSFKTFIITKPEYDKTNKMTYVPSKDADQPEHPPSLIRVFAVGMMKSVWVYKATQNLHSKDWSDWVDAQVIWVFSGHTGHFVGLVVQLLTFYSIFR